MPRALAGTEPDQREQPMTDQPPPPDLPPLPSLPPAPLTRETLLAWLDACGFETRIQDHPAVFTVEESTALHRQMAGGHTKNLFLRDRKGTHFLVTAEQSTPVDLKGLHKVIGDALGETVGRFSFGKPGEMAAWLGVTPGAVTAFGILNDREGHVRFVIDERLLQHEWINCHPLTNEATTGIRRDDLLRLARHCDHEPLVADLTGTGTGTADAAGVADAAGAAGAAT